MGAGEGGILAEDGVEEQEMHRLAAGRLDSIELGDVVDKRSIVSGISHQSKA